MSDTHRVNVVRVGAIRPHPNADKLELTEVGGYQIVIGKDNYKEGDLAVYIQPDSVVPQTEPFKFIWQDHVGIDGKVPERRRRITVKRLRKEYSEGLLMPVTDFPTELVCGILQQRASANLPLEGIDVAELIGVTHYVPECDRESTKAETAATPRRKYPKTLRGWFYWSLMKLGFTSARKNYAQEVSFNLPVYDIKAWKNYKNAFDKTDVVQITEKIHGSNARYTFILDNENEPLGPGKFYCGSHEQWKMDGGNVWWNVSRAFPQIGEWCTQNPGKVLYGEVGPTQKGFSYGADGSAPFFYAFDVFDPKTGNWTWAGNEGFAPTVPILYVGSFDIEKVKKYVDGDSAVPHAKNIREGVVIRRLSDNKKLKLVSNAYFEKDSK